MTTHSININFMILSLFCAGGLYAYLREANRLRRLISSGVVTPATIVKKEKIESGSESVVHFLITFEFTDNLGNTVIDEQDVNSKKFFSGVSVGDRIEILYRGSPTATSYPLSQIRSDEKIARWICGAILLFWGIMGMIIL